MVGHGMARRLWAASVVVITLAALLQIALAPPAAATTPTGAITFPTDHGVYERDSSANRGTPNWNDGCTTPGICGTASDTGDGIQKVEVSTSILSSPNNLYWDGTSFTPSASEVFVTANGTTDWSLPMDVLSFPSSTNVNLRIRITDNDSNVTMVPSTGTMFFSVDPTPGTRIDTKPPTYTNQTSATFTYSSPDAGSGVSFQCKFTPSTSFTSCPSDGTFSGLSDGGTYTLHVQAVDSAGRADSTPPGYSFFVDTTPPDTEITQKPTDPSNAKPITQFLFDVPTGDTSPGTMTFQCALDGGASPTYSACNGGSSQTYLPSDLSEGSHTFHVRAKDAAGNADPSPATYTWTVDKTPPPAPSIDSGPSGRITDTQPTFSFSDTENDVTFQCSLVTQGDPANYGACSSTGSDQTAIALSDGPYTFSVQASDPAGNTASKSQSFTVDTTGPSVTIDSGPTDGSTSGPDPSFTFHSPDGDIASFECKLDTGSFAACSSGDASGATTDGSHTFTVHGIDDLGNIGSDVSITWTVDATGPDVTILTGPSGTTTNGSASFTFSSSENTATFECKLDTDAGYSSCSSPDNLTNVTEGSRTFSVRAIDAYGNRGTPDTHTWTVDTTAPAAPKITGPAKTKSRRPKFSFTDASGDVDHYTCQLDGGTVAPCTSPFQPASKLRFGGHTLTVTAVDAAGNSTSATKKFKILRP